MTVVSTVSSMTAFFVGVVVGATPVGLYIAYRRDHQRKPGSLPVAPLYDIAGPPTGPEPAYCEDGTPPQVQLDENIAYERKRNPTLTD